MTSFLSREIPDGSVRRFCQTSKRRPGRTFQSSYGGSGSGRCGITTTGIGGGRKGVVTWGGVTGFGAAMVGYRRHHNEPGPPSHIMDISWTPARSAMLFRELRARRRLWIASSTARLVHLDDAPPQHRAG